MKRQKKIPLKFIAYGFGVVEPMTFVKQSEYLKLLKEWGFKISSLTKKIHSVKEIEENHNIASKKTTRTRFKIQFANLTKRNHEYNTRN